MFSVSELFFPLWDINHSSPIGIFKSSKKKVLHESAGHISLCGGGGRRSMCESSEFPVNCICAAEKEFRNKAFKKHPFVIVNFPTLWEASYLPGVQL